MLATYITLSNTLEKFFHPLVEVVIHDLSTEKIIHISGSLSKRKVGDDSLLEKNLLLKETELDKIIYEKRGIAGQTIKSVSILLPSIQKPTYMMCINADVSIFETLHSISSLFVGNTHPKPASLFQNDWQEKVHQAIFDFVTKNSWNITHLSLKEKKEVIRHLFESGAFEQKNAADYIADALDLSRTTVFNHLRSWRNK